MVHKARTFIFFERRFIFRSKGNVPPNACSGLDDHRRRSEGPGMDQWFLSAMPVPAWMSAFPNADVFAIHRRQRDSIRSKATKAHGPRFIGCGVGPGGFEDKAAYLQIKPRCGNFCVPQPLFELLPFHIR